MYSIGFCGIFFLAVVPCFSMFSLRSEQSIRLENVFDAGVHSPPGACRAGGKTYVVLSTDQTCYLHAADDGSGAVDLTPSWSCSLTSQPSVAAACADPGRISASGAPALFTVDANAPVRVRSAFAAPDRQLAGCSNASTTTVLVSQIDWGNSSFWYPESNGVLVLYSCGENGTVRLAHYSLYDA